MGLEDLEKDKHIVLEFSIDVDDYFYKFNGALNNEGLRVIRKIMDSDEIKLQKQIKYFFNTKYTNPKEEKVRNVIKKISYTGYVSIRKGKKNLWKAYFEEGKENQPPKKRINDFKDRGIFPG